jgi:hypothetical protein
MKRKSIRKFHEHGGEARSLAVTGYLAYRWLVWGIMVLAQFAFLPFREMAFAQSTLAVLNTGASPASMNTGNLPQSRVIYYDKNFVKNLKANTRSSAARHGANCPSRAATNTNCSCTTHFPPTLYRRVRARSAQASRCR